MRHFVFNRTVETARAFPPQPRCCIVIANEERLQRMTAGWCSNALDYSQAAAVKSGFLRQASLRARRFVSPANVLVSAREEDRAVWAGPLWFTRPGNRFISDLAVPTSFSTVAAILSVAARSPSCLITILPSDFWVARESVLTEAIEKASAVLQRLPGTVATLGMSDTHPGSDEDYLVVGPENPHWGAVIQAKANRPTASIAKQLLREGALVASGILLGHAQAFAARIHKCWPHLAAQLTHALSSGAPDAERRLSDDCYPHISRAAMSSIRLSAPIFPMRAFRVHGSGWCSRKPIVLGPSQTSCARRINSLES